MSVIDFECVIDLHLARNNPDETQKIMDDLYVFAEKRYKVHMYHEDAKNNLKKMQDYTITYNAGVKSDPDYTLSKVRKFVNDEHAMLSTEMTAMWDCQITTPTGNVLKYTYSKERRKAGTWITE